MSPLALLEAYSRAHPQEVLLVEVRVGEQEEGILIFKGVSSSLTGATVVDADVPLLPEEAMIVAVDRLRSPYNPSAPVYLERGILWEDFQRRCLGVS
ncbi:hypothetical protein NK55_07835 [Thermosynechococcus sp. NK55a]|uniref:DUF7734 family protein n=1 Tax=unclassified Thermosynechococcus TaxID=2622553 RepID=UPI0003D9540A|nr:MULTISPECIES: hypothetical protein [unclassified Thermosynechococcus]AHB88849.1 hypothetical protein NK55_07835 [Thermosynechococcus sp. NK55a]HIK24072.1 hypothetical protein [Thermosynechococcus sp. M3746_W2019_013]